MGQLMLERKDKNMEANGNKFGTGSGSSAGTKQGYYGGAGGWQSTKLSCSHAESLVFYVEEDERRVGFFAATKHKLSHTLRGKTLVVDLTGSGLVVSPVISKAPKGFEDLSQYSLQYQDVISFNWDDYSIPRLRDEFWVAFIDKVMKSDFRNVVVCCAGGHGRTGTFLSCVYAVVFKVSGWEAIYNIREIYCEEAVENLTQKNYIASIASHYNPEFEDVTEEDYIDSLYNQELRELEDMTFDDDADEYEDGIEAELTEVETNIDEDDDEVSEADVYDLIEKNRKSGNFIYNDCEMGW